MIMHYASPKPLAIFKMAGYRLKIVTSLVARPGSSPTLVIIDSLKFI